MQAVAFEVRTLSDEIADRQIDWIDLVKVDCEGFELEVTHLATSP